MRDSLEQALEACIRRIRQGETIEQCVSDYPEIGEDLEPLLRLSEELSEAETAGPSEDFRTESWQVVSSRLEPRQISRSRARAERPSLSERLEDFRLRLFGGGWSGKRGLVPVGALAGVAVIVALLLQPWATSPQLASGCAVTSTSGAVEVLLTGQSQWSAATDSMNLSPGERLRTGSSGEALLTFFEGSKVEVLPGTEVEIGNAEEAAEGQTAISFDQFSGKTWNRVIALVDPKSTYEVRTPAAYCLVRGTYFLVSVGEAQETIVEVEDGEVLVGAEGEEVLLSAGDSTTTYMGQAPGEEEETRTDEEPADEPEEDGPPDEEPPTTDEEPDEDDGSTDGGTTWVDDDDDDEPTPQYRVTLDSTVGGSVAAPCECTAWYENGTILDIEAVANPGYAFKQWAGDVATVADTTAAATTVRVRGRYHITAEFVRVYTLDVATVGNGTVTRTPDKPVYETGEVVTLTTVPDDHWEFDSWSGDAAGTDASIDITIAGDTSVAATFTEIEYVLTLNTSGNGNVDKSPAQATFHHGDIVQLTATPDAYWHFSTWSGDVVDTMNPINVFVTGDMAITGNFAKNDYTLTVNTVGNGSVSKNPDQLTYHYDDDVDLTATADPGWTFIGWSSDLSGPTNPETLTMDGNKTVTATFTQDEYTLTVNITGDGSVSQDPDQATYHYDDMVDLTATADPGWTFTGWSGDLSGSTNPETLTMDGNKTVNATFTQDEYTLTVNITGDGSVSKNPDQLTYHYGDDVDLTATADPGWTFAGWSGDLSGSTNPETLTMDGNKTVTATFTQDEYTLTVNITGDGSVSQDPDQATYHYGDDVDLTATADPGWTFTGWSGDLSGSTNPKTLTMDGNKTVNATFTQDEYTLTVNITGDGSVSKDPDQSTYHYGDVVQLTASPDFGWFCGAAGGWTGTVGDTDKTQNVTITGNTAVGVTFYSRDYSLTLTVPPDGEVTTDSLAGTYTLTSGVWVLSCESGETVDLLAIPHPGYSFKEWRDDYGDLTGDKHDADNSIIMDNDYQLEADFESD